MSNTQKGTSWFTRYIKRGLGEEKNNEINSFVEQSMSEEFLDFTSEAEIHEYLGEMVKQYVYSLNMDEISDLRFYTGYDFKNINNTMRGKWNYEENGLLTQEKKDMYNELGERIYKVINKFPQLNLNIKAYRGVNIKAFWDYGVYTLDDISVLEGQYIYESGFSSTSLLRSNSFFEKQSEWGSHCNVEIEYFIPGISQDGAVLLSDALSFSKAQMEYVINSGSLTKITGVEVDKEKGIARLKAFLIPRALWDPKQLEQGQTVKK